MSTRCHVVIKDDDNKFEVTHFIYRHCDGYPSAAGEDLKTILREYKSDLGFNIPDLVKEIMDSDNGFEDENCGIHGDEEYIYMIDIESTEECTIICYDILSGWDYCFSSLDNNCKKIFSETYRINKELKELNVSNEDIIRICKLYSKIKTLMSVECMTSFLVSSLVM